MVGVELGVMAMAVLGLTVNVAVAVQAGVAASETVTVYVPAGTFVGFWPVRPPVQA